MIMRSILSISARILCAGIMMSYIQRDKNSEKRKKQPTKQTSHKDVGFLLVGTGVLDGPKRHNCSAVDKDNPDRF